MTELSKKPSYRADIQGLRGIAVLLVVIYHSGLPLFGGFIGVDVFFVLSGFVITEGMLRALGKGTFSFADFYTKRVRRLLPALAVMLSVVIATMFWLGPIVSRVFTVRTGVAAALLNANHYLIRGPGYFDPSTEYNALLHTWSLSVEEQFYLVFPLALYLLWRVGGENGRARRLMLGVGMLSVASFALCVWWSYTDKVFGFDGVRLAFYTALTRSWQFGGGVFIALAAPRLARSVFARSWSGWVGLAMILGAALFFDKETVFPGYAALLPTLGAALALISGLNSERMGMVSRALSYRPLVRIGDLSYSWYLWHWPLIVFAAANFPHIPLEASVSAAFLSLGVAWLSERWVENPIRYRDSEQRRPIVLVAAFSILLPVATFGLNLVVYEPHERNALEDVRENAGTRNLVQNVLLAGEEYRQIGCDLGSNAKVSNECIWGQADSPSVLLAGDSNAKQFIPMLKELVPSLRMNLRAATFPACPFLDLTVVREGRPNDFCRFSYEERMREIEKGDYDIVVISNSADYYIEDTEFALEFRGTAATHPSDKMDIYRRAMERTVSALNHAGVSVILVDPIPKLIRSPARTFAEEFRTSRELYLVSRCSMMILSKRPSWCVVRRPVLSAAWRATSYGDTLHRNLDARRINITSTLCPDRTCESFTGNDVLYQDAGHIAPAAARLVRSCFESSLRDAAPLR